MARKIKRGKNKIQTIYFVSGFDSDDNVIDKFIGFDKYEAQQAAIDDRAMNAYYFAVQVEDTKAERIKELVENGNPFEIRTWGKGIRITEY